MEHIVYTPNTHEHGNPKCVVWSLSSYGLVIETGPGEHPDGYCVGHNLVVAWPSTNADGTAVRTNVCTAKTEWTAAGYRLPLASPTSEGVTNVS